MLETVSEITVIGFSDIGNEICYKKISGLRQNDIHDLRIRKRAKKKFLTRFFPIPISEKIGKNGYSSRYRKKRKLTEKNNRFFPISEIIGKKSEKIGKTEKIFFPFLMCE